MTDMVEVKMRGDDHVLSNWEEYSPEDLAEIFQGLIRKAEESGLTKCFLRFESMREPYEDWLADPIVFACGYREKTSVELAEDSQWKEAEALAKEIGVCVSDAQKLLVLEKQGKIKISHER